VEPDAPLHFNVVYEDGHVLLVDKPSGLPTAPAGGFLEHTLLALVRGDCPHAVPMHRLGRGTSGLVVFAKTVLARERIAAAWRRQEIRKIYRALATGEIPLAPFTISVPIGPVPHPKLGTVFSASPDGKPSTSHISLLEQRANAAVVRVHIDTGRPHQIRIHLAAAGHPLVGDPLYGAGGVVTPDALPGDGGYLLHAESIAFVHPETEREVTFAAPIPPGALQAGLCGCDAGPGGRA
jgi:23S rRNA pseudouridine1911/1915/1917 synthase